MLSTESKAIASQYGDRSPLSLADRQIIANVLTWDAQHEVSPSDIETIAIQHDIV